MRSWARIAAVAGALTVATAACGGSGKPAVKPSAESSTPAGKTGQVSIKNIAFRPQAITVAAGTAVTWTNDDELPHTVTAGDPNDAPTGQFDGPLETKGSSFTFAFPTVGTFKYYCKVHPQMTGTVTVS